MRAASGQTGERTSSESLIGGDSLSNFSSTQLPIRTPALYSFL
jgi:hypothetical protein